MAKKKNSSKNVTKNPQYAAGTPVANRNYKDTVFRLLFSDKENLLSLYNAVSGSVHTDSSELEIIGAPSIQELYRCFQLQVSLYFIMEQSGRRIAG